MCTRSEPNLRTYVRGGSCIPNAKHQTFATMREAVVPSRIQQVSILLLAAALVAAGVAGGQWFMEANYVVFGYLVRERWHDIPAEKFVEIVFFLALPTCSSAAVCTNVESTNTDAWCVVSLDVLVSTLLSFSGQLWICALTPK